MTKDTPKADPLTTPYPDMPKARQYQPEEYLKKPSEERPAVPSVTPGSELAKPAPDTEAEAKRKAKQSDG